MKLLSVGHIAWFPLVLALAACGDSPTGVTEEPPVSGGTTGNLAVAIQGLPAGANASVTVRGPGDFARTITGTQTLGNLAPGAYAVTIADVPVSGVAFGTDQTLQYAEVKAGQTANITAGYRAFNLAVENFYINQSVQKSDGSIPLVAGRDGYLRVFAKANNANTVQAPVRVRIYHNGALRETLTIPAPSFAAPTEINELLLGTSWNAKIPGALIQPGMSMLVDIDPEGKVGEGSKADNQFPANGARALDARAVPKLRIMLVPIQSKDAPMGNVTEANKNRYLTDLLRMFPIADYEVQVRAPYVTGTNLQAGGGGWGSLVNELDNLRKGEGFDGYYYGVVNLPYQSGVYGIAYRPGKTAIGNDFLDSRNLNASMTLAHELGHSMDRPHSQCGSAGFPDIEYPHPNGQIGSFGLDLTSLRLYGADTKDLMGYCEDRWIGDHTYQKVLEYRLTRESTIR